MAIRIGVDYYPEQWDEALWEKDAAMMKEAGVSIVRLAEFAWSKMEPREGDFDFAWLDRIIDIFAGLGIDVVLGTPTCTPPLWLFENYPDAIQKDVFGNRMLIGIRGHRCLTSPVFRRYAERIIRRMVERYRDNKSIIAYQIDNELEANHCRCENCQEEFRRWIKKRYSTVEKINKAYGNTVWSGEYSDFSEVKPPMGEHIRWQNPSLTLDYNRFASDSTIEYLEWQRNIIHSIVPNIEITTNTWFCENMPDFYSMFSNLSFVSYDNYPTTRIPEDYEELYSHAFHLDLMRGIKDENFWIMEQLSGPMGSWSNMSQNLYPGMLKGYSLQAVAHGADTVVHFRWRTGCSGAEMYWHGILDHNNVPGRRYREFCELCETLKNYPELSDSVVDNKVAILYGSDEEYAFKLQYQAEGLYYLEQLKSFHDAFTSIGIGVDIIDEKSELSDYAIVIAPTLMVTNDSVKNSLYEFTSNGGTVLLTNRTGVKDSNNKCIMAELPTVYSELTGIRINEYDVIGSNKLELDIVDNGLRDAYAESKLNAEESGYEVKYNLPMATQWCDLITTAQAKTLMTYQGRYYEGMPAVTQNRYGEGLAYYVGTVLDRSSYVAIAKLMARECNLHYEENLPVGVEITYRKSKDCDWRFIFNNTMKEQCFEGRTLKAFEMLIEETPNL